jgi:putative MATE family efflux protein
LGSDRKTILNLALPAVLQTVLRSFFIIIDAFWIGKMGSTELAALTAAAFVVWGGLELGDMISTGNGSLIAQTSGAKEFTLAKKIAVHNIVNSFFYSLTLGLFFILLLPLLYKLMSLSPEHSLLSDEYLGTLFLGLPCIILLSTVNSIFRGNGDTKTPFWLLFIALILNFFLNPLLIFGIDGFLKFGMKGAAIATLISYSLSFIIGIVIAYKKKLILPLRKYRVDFGTIKETVKIGLPVSLNGLAFSFIYIILARFISEYGTVGFASVGISHRSESLSYQITVGFSLAAAILTGQSVGANDTSRAEKLAMKTLGYGSIVIIIYSLLLFIFSAEVASIFTKDIDVINTTSLFNKITAVVIIFSAVEVILSGAFAGAGDSVPPAVISTSINIMRIPFAGILSVYFGLIGIWIGIAFTVFLKGIMIFTWFKRGKWKNKKTKLLGKEPPMHLFD